MVDIDDFRLAIADALGAKSDGVIIRRRVALKNTEGANVDILPLVNGVLYLIESIEGSGQINYTLLGQNVAKGSIYNIVYPFVCKRVYAQNANAHVYSVIYYEITVL